MRIPLSTLYDGDRRLSDPTVAELAATVMIPHPLHGVTYADGANRCTHARMCHHPAGREMAR